MQTITIVGGPVRFGVGAILGLTFEQAVTRLGSLTELRGDLFEVKTPVEFKAGETLTVSLDDVPKHLASRVQIVGGDVAEEVTDDAEPEVIESDDPDAAFAAPRKSRRKA